MPFNVGENAGPYRIVEQLGQGGMATVFKAYHASLDRYVALKVLHPAFNQDPNFETRFQREARVVAKLEHPHIVPVYDYAEHDKRPFLVMKYIEGITLKARLDQGPLSSGEVTKIVDAVGSALAYAHRQGILHRDIKPSNVLLANDGQIYLADFGLARIAQSGESTLSSDMIMGTPQYISPEQAMGKGDLDLRTDLYSFGVMLYEMVVGRVPFSADTPFSIIHDHIYSPLPLPHTVNPNVPESVERVLLKALAKERDDRYENAAQLVSAFKSAWDQTAMSMRDSEVSASQVETKISPLQAGSAQSPDSPLQTKVALPAEAVAMVEENVQEPAKFGEYHPESDRGSKKKRWSWRWLGVALVVVSCVGALGIARSTRLFARVISASRAVKSTPTIVLLEPTPQAVEPLLPLKVEHPLFIVTASNFEQDKPPANVLDGNPQTTWSSGGHPEQWIQIDFGAPRAVRVIRLVISQTPAGQTFHQIFGGMEEEKLVLLHEFIGKTSEPGVLVFRPVVPLDVRFIKVLTKESPSWVAWRDIEIEFMQPK